MNERRQGWERLRARLLAVSFSAAVSGAMLLTGGCSDSAGVFDVVSVPVDSTPVVSSPSVVSLSPGHLASSLTALFQKYLDNPNLSMGGLSPVETEALQHAVVAGTISTTDYEKAHAELEACYIQNGVDGLRWNKGIDGVYSSSSAYLDRVSFTQSEWIAASNICDPLTDSLDFLYAMQQSNPDLLSDQYEQAVACLKRTGVVDEGYTVKDFKKYTETLDYTVLPFDPFTNPYAKACLASAGWVF